MPEIAFITYDQCLASSITLPMEMYRAATDASTAITRKKYASPLLYGKKKRTHCAGGVEIISHRHPKWIDQVDLIVLPAIWRNPMTVVNDNRYLLAHLHRWNQANIKICAVGTSSFFLAESGLLNHRGATTHWSQIEEFGKHYPSVQIKKDFLITQSQNLFCAASINSVADLMIHFIEQMFDKNVAKKVEANFSPEIRRSYATSLHDDDRRHSHSDEDMVRLQDWLKDNFKSNLNISNMAKMLDISVRSLNRRFKEVMKTTPNQYIQQLKIDHAKDLLRDSNLDIGDVAEQCGFHDNSYFCQRFKKMTTLSPQSYRQAVKAKLFSNPA